METMREREAEVHARRSPARQRDGVAAGAPLQRKKFRSVTYLPSGRYAAAINEPGVKKRTWLGTYNDEEVAACAYDLAARSLYGTKAKTNFDYPLRHDLVDRVTSAPGCRGPVYPAPPPPAPAPAPAAAPPAAPMPVDHFSFKAPPSEPALSPVYPFLKDTPSARKWLGLRAPVLASVPGTKITFVRSIPPKAFSIQAAVAESRIVSDPADFFAPPIHLLAPASSAESSTTDSPQLRDSASSSWRMVSNSRHLMLKTPKIFAVPTTAPTPSTSDEGFSGDNFTGGNAPLYFTLPPSAMMPIDLGGL